MPPDIQPPWLAIIADDLTGALDAAAPFAGRGLRVEVALQPDAVPSALAIGPDIIAITTGSRDLSPEAAAQAVAQTAQHLPAGIRLFKKVDSRLKGHIAAEIGILPFTHALVAPAIPDFGRIVQAGTVKGFGVDIPIAIAPVLGELAKRCTIPETASEDEMRAALQQGGHADLLVGARGLAEALAKQVTGQHHADIPPLAGPRGVMVVGSRDPITLAQVAQLRANEKWLRYLPAPNGIVTTNKPPHPLTLIQALAGPTEIKGAEVAHHLALGVHSLLAAGTDTIFLTGGATAEAVLAMLNVRQMRLLGECLPGLPVATSQGLTIVTKSGGFGPTDTLLRVARMIGKAE